MVEHLDSAEVEALRASLLTCRRSLHERPVR
jgi:hypothetical protein